jgi:hypothetical protein
VFKDLQKRNGAFINGLKIMKNGWQNLIGIIFIFQIYFLDVFKRTGNCLIRICGKNNFGLSIIKADVLIYKRMTQFIILQ